NKTPERSSWFQGGSGLRSSSRLDMRLRQRAGNLETTGAIAEKLYVQSAAQRCGATKPIDAARSLQFALLNFETAITKNEPAPKAIDVQRSATNRKRHMWKDAVVRIEVQRPCRGRKQFGSIQAGSSYLICPIGRACDPTVVHQSSELSQRNSLQSARSPIHRRLDAEISAPFAEVVATERLGVQASKLQPAAIEFNIGRDFISDQPRHDHSFCRELSGGAESSKKGFLRPRRREKAIPGLPAGQRAQQL